MVAELWYASFCYYKGGDGYPHPLCTRKSSHSACTLSEPIPSRSSTQYAVTSRNLLQPWAPEHEQQNFHSPSTIARRDTQRPGPTKWEEPTVKTAEDIVSGVGIRLKILTNNKIAGM
jgi:hypothetical protein